MLRKIFEKIFTADRKVTVCQFLSYKSPTSAQCIPQRLTQCTYVTHSIHTVIQVLMHSTGSISFTYFFTSYFFISVWDWIQNYWQTFLVHLRVAAGR